MVTTRRKNQVGARRSQRRVASSKNKIKKTSTRNRKLFFKKANDKLESLKTKQRGSEQTKRNSNNIRDDQSNDADREHPSPPSITPKKRPIRKVTIAALKNIGKVARSERKYDKKCKIRDETNEDGSDDSSYNDNTSKVYQPDLPEMPTFPVNDDDTIDDDQSVSNTSGVKNSKAKGASSVFMNGTQKADDDNASLGGDSTIVDADDSIEDTFVGGIKKKSSSIPTILRGHTDDDVSTIKTVHIVDQLTLSNINDIFNYFKLPKSSKSCMPSRRDREEGLDLKVTNKKKWSAMINITSKCMDQILNIICPGPSQIELRKAVASRIQYEGPNTDDRNNKNVLDGMLDTIFSCIKKSKKGSIERRLLRAITVKSLKRNIIQRMCQKHLLNDITSGSIHMQVNNDIPNMMDGIPLAKT